MDSSETLTSLAPALVALQGKLDNAHKANVNPHFKNRYADLATVRQTVQEPLSKAGFAITQLLGGDGKVVTCETILMHSSGEWISGSLVLPVSKNDPQGHGSAITYARRYGMMAILGITADDDDDANLASRQDNDSSIGADTAYIDTDQQQELVSLASEVGADLGRFMKFLKVESLHDLPASKFASAVKALEAKRA